jgi:hypothetical protein
VSYHYTVQQFLVGRFSHGQIGQVFEGAGVCHCCQSVLAVTGRLGRSDHGRHTLEQNRAAVTSVSLWRHCRTRITPGSRISRRMGCGK